MGKAVDSLVVKLSVVKAHTAVRDGKLEHIGQYMRKVNGGFIVHGTHVTSSENAANIRTNGFRVSHENQNWGSGSGLSDNLGHGVYVGIHDTDGVHRSEALYQKQYSMHKKPHETLHVEARVSNPVHVDYDSFSRKAKYSSDLNQVGEKKHKALFSQVPGFAEKYDEIAKPRLKAYHDYLTSDKFGREEHNQPIDTEPSEVLQHLGYDSVMFHTKQKKATVGGSQLVVFDPKKVHVTS